MGIFFNKIIENKIINILFKIVFIISIMSFSFIFSTSTIMSVVEKRYELIGLWLSLIFGIFLLSKKIPNKLLKEAKNWEIILSGISSIILINEIRLADNLYLASTYIVDFIQKYNLGVMVSVSTKLFAIIFAFFGFLFLLIKIGRYFIDFFKSFDKKETIFGVIYFIILSILVVISYSNASYMYLGYDHFFSIDTFYVNENMFGKIFWALDIRHVLFAPIVLPVKVAFAPLLLIFNNIDILYYVLLAMFNIAILIMIGVMLKRLTNNKWTMYIFMLSYPCLQYSLLIEKYQICAFFIVLFFYERYYNKKNKTVESASLICSIGTMTTSVFLGLFSGYGKLKNRIIYWIKMAAIFICLCGVFGKINLMIESLDLVNNMVGNVPVKATLFGKLCGISELFASFFFIPQYKFIENGITFMNKASYMNYIGIIVFIIMVIGFLAKRNDKFIRACLLWIGTALILFIGMNWYCYEAPLFSIYYSWAGIPLIVMAIEKIKNNKCKTFLYLSIIILMLVINIPEFINIYNFILRMG